MVGGNIRSGPILQIVDAGTAYVAVYLAAPGADDWPVDVGDDPAFECSRAYAEAGGCLSWGVCRPDLRNEITPGDVVVFIAADRLRDRRPARYRLAGWGTASGSSLRWTYGSEKI